MPTRDALRPRAAAVAAALALALGAAACGGSDDDGGGSGNGAENGGPSTPADDRREARATVERLYAAIADGDAERVCEQLNEDARKQLAEGGLGSKSGSCSESFQKFLDQAEEAGGLDLTLKAKVKSIKVTGDKAVAKVGFGKGRNGEIPLEKVDGEWKLQAAGAAPTPSR